MCKHVLLILTDILWCLSGSKRKVFAKSFILCGGNYGPENWSHVPRCAQLVELRSSSFHLPLSELLQDTTLASDSCIQSTQFRHTVYPAKEESRLSLRKNSLNWCFGATETKGRTPAMASIVFWLLYTLVLLPSTLWGYSGTCWQHRIPRNRDPISEQSRVEYLL